MLRLESKGVTKRKPFRKPRTLDDGKSTEVPRSKKKFVLRLGPRDTRNKRLEDDNVTSKSLCEDPRGKSIRKRRALPGDQSNEDPRNTRNLFRRLGPRDSPSKRLDDDNATSKERRRSKSFCEDSKRESFRKHRASSDEKLEKISKQDKKELHPRYNHRKRLNGGKFSPREATRESNVADNKRKLSPKPKPLDHEKPAEISNYRKKQSLSRLNDTAISAKGKLFQKQKSAVDEEQEEAPKRTKKKRVIRLDPYDTSNKRLDDGIVIPEIQNPKPKEVKRDGLSKNAQFRSINPSQPILTFVENNLLGRRRPIELQKSGYNTDLSAPLDNIPFSSTEERERIEDNIFRNKLNFFAAAKVESSLPPPNLPEIAFAGRSNVGKSSLLNSLTRQWGVARTSEKPGLTQTINFFELGSKLCLVDLPGYGFAYAKEEVKDAWEDLVKEYVTSRSSLKRVCLLVDTKWGMKARDYELVHLMESFRTSYQIVMTKTDLVFPMDVARRAMQIEENLKANRFLVHPLMMVSSKSGAGVRCLRTVLSKIARFAKV